MSRNYRRLSRCQWLSRCYLWDHCHRLNHCHRLSHCHRLDHCYRSDHCHHLKYCLQFDHCHQSSRCQTFGKSDLPKKSPVSRSWVPPRSLSHCELPEIPLCQPLRDTSLPRAPLRGQQPLTTQLWLHALRRLEPGLGSWRQRCRCWQRWS